MDVCILENNRTYVALYFNRKIYLLECLGVGVGLGFTSSFMEGGHDGRSHGKLVRAGDLEGPGRRYLFKG